VSHIYIYINMFIFYTGWVATTQWLAETRAKEGVSHIYIYIYICTYCYIGWVATTQLLTETRAKEGVFALHHPTDEDKVIVAASCMQVIHLHACVCV